MRRTLAVVILSSTPLAACGDGASHDFIGSIEPFIVEPATPLPEVEFQRRGKIVALDTTTRRLDPLHDRLPEALRARRPEEVGTIALVACETKYSGRYAYILASAYSQDCRLRLLDAKTRAFIANTGASRGPPRVYFPFWPRTAARPTDILLDAVKQLPDRPPA